jgi:signal peptidase II
MKKPLLIVFVALLIDQLVKVWVKTSFTLGEEVEIFSWFRLYFIENKGMAFGAVLPFEDPDLSKLILSVFRIVAVGFIGYYLYNLVKTNKPKGLIISISLILAGAIGNIIDSMVYGLLFTESKYYELAQFEPGNGYGRFLHGQVVDMMQFTMKWPDFVPYLGGGDVFGAIWNLADSYITIGVATIILFQKSFFEEPKKAPTEVEA